MTLSEYLSEFDFDYEVVKGEEYDKAIKLIDLQGVYLGDIGSEEYEYSKNGILSIQERMSTYIEDYIIRPCEDMLDDCWNENYSYNTWQELYNLIKKHGDKELKEYADYWYPYILGYKICEFDKEHNNGN